MRQMDLYEFKQVKPSLQSKFHESQGYTEKPYLKKTNNNNNKFKKNFF